MNYLGWFLLIIVGALVSGLAYIIARFNLKRQHVIHCASEASDETLEQIFCLVENLGEISPSTYVLAKTNQNSPDRVNRISIPVGLDDFPWRGKTYQIEVDDDVHFRQVDASGPEAQFLGRIYRLVAVPRSKTKSGKPRNMFSPQRYYTASTELQHALGQSCPKYPMELLSYLMCSGRSSFEFDALNQARIAGSIEWVQSPEFPNCDTCNRRMAIIFQVPGTMLHPKRLHSGVFYFFGCKQHPESIKSITQFS